MKVFRLPLNIFNIKMNNKFIFNMLKGGGRSLYNEMML